MILILAVIAGLLALRMLPLELNPEISLNWVNVSTLYTGATPEEVEQLITIKIEDAIADIDNISSITSWSGEGYSRVSVKFDDIDDQEFQRLYQELITEVGKVKLPESAEEPFYFKWSSNTFLPVLNIAVYGDVEEKELRKIARSLKDEVADMPSISKITIAGERDREYWVEVVPEKLNALKLSFDEIQNALMQKNISVSAGAIKGERSEVVFRLVGEFKSPKDLLETIIRINGTQVLRVGDIATVKESFKRAATLSKFNGKPAITISAFRKPGYGTIDVVDEMKAIVKRFQDKLPSSIGVGYATDTTYMIEDGIDVLTSNALMGIILVLFILHAFLGLRNAMFAAIGIPTSFLITFIFLYLTDQTMNLSVMFGMVLVLGMIVDDAMVIIENVYRYIEEGYTPLQAVKKGVPEVAVPVSASIMTTMAAFLPLMLMPGIMGKFMRTIPFVVCLSLAASVVEAFFIMPVHIGQFGRKEKKPPVGEKYVNKVRNIYDKALRFSLKGKSYLVGGVVVLFFMGVGLLTPPEGKPAIAIIIFVVLFVTMGISKFTKQFRKRFAFGLFVLSFAASSLIFAKTIHVEMFAAEPFNAIFLRVKAPTSTSLEEMERILAQFEERVSRLPRHEYENIITNVGVLNLDTETLNGANVGEVILDIVPAKDRERPNGEEPRHIDLIVADLQEWTKDISGVEWSAILYPQDGPPTGKPIEVKILGERFEQLQEIANKIEDFLKNTTGVKNVDNDFQEGKAEYRFYPNEYQMKQAGLSYAQVGNTMQKVVSGQPVGIVRDAEEEMLVMLKYPENYISNKPEGEAIRIANAAGNLVPLSNLGTFKEERVLSLIKRYKRDRAVAVSADVDEGISAVEVNQSIITYFETLKSQYPGYRLSFEGEFKEFESAFNSLITLFLIGIGIMFLILGTQFRSWVRPFLIMITIPLAFVGAMFGLVVSDSPFSIGSMYGMVALAGVVVNSAIVFVDFINKERERGLSMIDAIISAGHIRFRPIVLTSITTVFGMLPLAIGIGGSNLNWQPLAVVIVAGLFMSTFLTLFLIPTFYILFENFIAFYKRAEIYRIFHRAFFGIIALGAFVGMLLSGDVIIGVILLILLSLLAFLFDMEIHDSKAAKIADESDI